MIKYKIRKAFTMLELIFVIVIMGIIGKFGVEFLAQAYEGYIFGKINNSLQTDSATAVEFIAKRLQDRVKDSIIARKSSDRSFEALGSATGSEYNVLEWIGGDVDGFRGNSESTPNFPNWSAVLDLRNNEANSTIQVSPETNTSAISKLIGILSNGSSDINNSAIYFIGSNSDINTSYGWNVEHNHTSLFPINSTNKIYQFEGNFTDSTVWEYYKLTWSAYALELNTTTHNLSLWYNYQPWENEDYTDGNQTLLMNNVDTFQFMAIGSIVKIQVCVFSDLVKNSEYSLCKEKTIY